MFEFAPKPYIYSLNLKPMKKYLLVLILSAFTLFNFAQTPLRFANNFTAITMTQDTFVLTELLSQHKYVGLEFFFAESVLCKETSVYVSQAYEQLGRNEQELVILSINVGNDSAQCQHYIDSLGIQTPVVSGTWGKGDTIAQIFDIQSFPTFILISPDTLDFYDLDINDTITETDTTYYTYDTIPYRYNIAIDDVWPIYSANDIIDTLTHNFPIYEYTSVFDLPIAENKSFSIYPNRAQNVVYLKSLDLNDEVIVRYFNISGQLMGEQKLYLKEGEETLLDISKLRKGSYILQVLDTEKSDIQRLIIQ